MGTHNWGQGNRPRRNSTVRAQHRRRCPPRFCAQCRASGPDVKLIQDHIIGLAAGGLDVVGNYQWLCQPRQLRPYTRPLTPPLPILIAPKHLDRTEGDNVC